MKSLAAIQSSYVPWKGYFDVIAAVDEFVLYDDVQFTKNDWRNRNLVKSGNGTMWLTIPVRTKNRFGQAIRDVEVSDPRWSDKHWKSIVTYYSKAPHFDALAPWLEGLYREIGGESRLSVINERFIRAIAELLRIETEISQAGDYDLPDDRSERLVALCRQAGADVYLSGPAARSYLDRDLFARHDIEVRWMDYSGYPEYHQLHGEFEHGVSILDLLLNVGPEGAKRYTKNLGTMGGG